MEGDAGIDPNEFNADQTGTHQNALSFSHGYVTWTLKFGFFVAYQCSNV